ncbi:unnamed protein product [Dracunculus medinensis]|uniref:U3 small nucleolar RNA-associated protein 6-like protein n=1 Tax=Dracunculus medinensis TaxID=318479 RepID=A0A158Q6F8_DRAME|nr:unnamed protein product [Dracunculus medinensis]
MAEFVEENLERLLPFFEVLHYGALFSKGEVNEFIKRCRNYEYRIHKTVKVYADFLLYADYLQSALKLIKIRRKKLNYFGKRKEIENNLLSKIADLYRICSERFKVISSSNITYNLMVWLAGMGNMEIWRKRLDFLRKNRLRNRCSKAFLQIAQIFESDFKLREEAALWEFKENGSIENARLHLQLCLRRFPEIISLWTTLFEIEIRNAKKMSKRREILLKSKDAIADSLQKGDQNTMSNANEKNNEMDDPVLSLKIAELVANQAIRSYKDVNVIIYELWRKARSFGKFTSKLENYLYNKLWLPDGICEESWIARYERQSDYDDCYDLLDEACNAFPTEKMYRKYIEICEKRGTAGDVYALSKLHELFEKIYSAGWAKSEDFERLLDAEKDEERKQKILDAALLKNPSSSKFWLEKIHYAIQTENANIDKIKDIFNEALQFVEDDGMLEIYKVAIDWAIANCPLVVDSLFDRAILISSVDTSSELKCLRLRYAKVHRLFIDMEKKRKIPSKKLIIKAMENYVNDLGYQEYKCWIYYAEYLLVNDPAFLSKLHQRAITCIPNSLLNDFNLEWTILMQKRFINDSMKNKQTIAKKRRKIKKKSQVTN